MTQEEIQKYADELAQQYFPDEANIWARENLEAKFVSGACMRMAKHIERELIEKVCEWLKENIDIYAKVVINTKSNYPEIVMCDTFEKNFKKAMEE